MQIEVDRLAYVGGARHALFFAVPMLLIGEWIAENKVHEKIKTQNAVILFIITWILAFFETMVLRKFLGDGITLDVSMFGWMPAFALVIVGLREMNSLPSATSRSLRKVIDVVYIIHVWVILVVGKLLGVGYLGRFILATAISFVCAFMLNKCAEKIKVVK